MHQSRPARRLVSPRSAIFLFAFLVAGLGLLYVVASDRWRHRQTKSDQKEHLLPRNAFVRELPAPDAVRPGFRLMAFSPDGKSLALWKPGEVQLGLLESKTGEVRILACPFSHGGGAGRLAFSDDGRLLAAYYVGAGVAVWDLSKGSEQARVPVSEPGFVSDMAFTKDGRTIVAFIASSGPRNPADNLRPKYAVRWDALTGKTQGTQTFDSCRRFIGISPDGRYTILVTGQGTAVLDLTTGTRAFVVDGDSGFCFSKDSSTLASYDGRQIRVIEMPSGRELKRFTFESSYLVPGYEVRDCLAVSPDSKLLAIGWFGKTNLVGIVSLASGKVLGTFECGPSSMFCERVLFSPDGRILASETRAINMNDAVVEPLLKFWQIPASW